LSFSNELTLLATSTFAVVARAAIPSIYKKIKNKKIKRQQFITSGYCTVLYQLIIQGYYKRNRHFQRYVVSPDLTPCDFFSWGYIKDRVFIPPLPVRLNELKQRITTAVASVDEDTLRSIWTELDYRIDICRVTKGSHIEYL
jgi:hypothetical protein